MRWPILILSDEVKEHFQKNFPELKVTITGMTASLPRPWPELSAVWPRVTPLLFRDHRLDDPADRQAAYRDAEHDPQPLSHIPDLGHHGLVPCPLDLFTMLVGSISIGLAVDDTIHFMHNFRRYFEHTGDAKQAVMETLHSTGRAMLITTCVLSLGFFIFMFASMNNLFNFGWLTGFTIITALLADYFIAPALMVLVNRKK